MLLVCLEALALFGDSAQQVSGELRRDNTPGSDTWAVREGWVAVTPLGLRSDLAFGEARPSLMANPANPNKIVHTAYSH